MDATQRVRAILSFVQVADGGSFAAAARKLGVSSASVSKNVAGLERALGVRLMNRTTRTLKLTSEGVTFLEQARIALDALDLAVDTVAAQRVEPSGRVRISTSAAFGRDQLMPALPGLLERYPELSVEVDFDDRCIDLINEGYDLALRGGQIPDSALVSRTICRLNMALFASPAYLGRHGVPRTPQDLKQHKIINRRFLNGSYSKWSFRSMDGSIETFEPEASTVTLSSPEALAQAALLGLGIAQVGVHHAWPHLRAGTLKVVLNDCHHPGDYEMVLQYPHRALLAPRVHAVINYLLEVFSKDDFLHVPLKKLQSYVA